jgi:integrase
VRVGTGLVGEERLAALEAECARLVALGAVRVRLLPADGTVSRRFSVAAGFYRTCVIDGVLEHSPAEYVRRPAVPAESPTLGFTHLQFEALLTAAREEEGASGGAADHLRVQALAG